MDMHNKMKSLKGVQMIFVLIEFQYIHESTILILIVL